MSKFKPIVLFNDIESKTKTLNSYEQQKEMLSHAITDLFGILKQLDEPKLTDEDLQKFLKIGKPMIIDYFRKGFPHPKASDQINLDLLGISKLTTSNIDRASSLITNFDIVNQKPVLKEKAKLRVEKNNTILTENEKQNKAFEVASMFLKASTDAIENDFIGKYEFNLMLNNNPFIYNGLNTDKPRINHQKIMKIK